MSLLNTSIAAVVGASLMSTGGSIFTNHANTASTSSHKAVKVASAPAEQNKVPAAPAAAPQPKTVAVQPGDYLDKIASSNDTTSLRIFYANTQISNPDLIYPSQQLRIPTNDEALTPRDVPVNQQIATPTATESVQAAAPRATTVVAAPAVSGGSVWDSLAACESGGNWAINTGNGFYGGLQFTLGSWQAVGGSGLPSQASREEQIMRGQMLQARGGWGNWPACSAKLGLR